jgi:hypothetical protein
VVAELRSGEAAQLVMDLDSTISEVHGKKNRSGAIGYTTLVLGYFGWVTDAGQLGI